MDKRNMNRITMGFIVLVMLVIVLMLANSLRRSAHIVLPEEPGTSDQENQEGQGSDSSMGIVEVSPDTVQAAIETLERPDQYRRTITVERLWNGGSGTSEIDVTVSGKWTRTDVTLADGQIRHAITDGETTYIWYNSARQVYTASAGSITADDEQAIPTYEDILQLPTERIAVADYRTLSGINCIYVETSQDPDGYTLRYWVGVDTGLLVAAEKLQEGETVYRMGALSVDLTVSQEESFTLPNGTHLNVE